MAKKLRRTIGTVARKVLDGIERLSPGTVVTRRIIEDAYVDGIPSAQNAADIFAGEWNTAFPDALEITAGSLRLFEDVRIVWAAEALGGFEGKDLCELGPLEGAHAAMLESMGAARITAVEANRRAYLKCLVTKEILGLSRVRFLLGDACSFLRAAGEPFDAILALGILYHQVRPIRLLAAIAERTDRFALWTHYWTKDQSARIFQGEEEAEDNGFRHELHRVDYKKINVWKGCPGGPDSHCNWLSRADLLSAIDHLGFEVIDTAFDDPAHPHGPALALAARRRT